MRAVILNAYRRSNAGDGLLVDEAAALVREAFPGIEITLVSMEPESFPEHPGGLHPIAGTASEMRTIDLLARLLTGRAHRAVVDAVDAADIAVAVGGGYFRGDHVSAAIKSYLSHVVQAPSRSTRTPHVYLPQSIGPIPPKAVPFGLWRLRRAHTVFVRDDRSFTELGRYGVRSVRMPDLAAISIGTDAPVVREGGGRAALVARSLKGREDGYQQRLRSLRESLNPEILVQSSGAGNDDPTFYDRMGWGADHRRLLDALKSEDAPGVVVSVRLHGSLQSILAGVPSIHLSYERKGWGAYEDLGIAPYVHNAWTFDPDTVVSQVRELSADPASYWARIAERRPRLAEARAHIVSTLRDSVK